MTPFETPRLIADIGGTYARFALETSLGRFDHAASLRCAEYPDFAAAVTAYLASVATKRPQHAAVAIATPVDGDLVRMTNYHWKFSIEAMREHLRFDTLVVVNDFTALAMAVPRLSPLERRQVGNGRAREGSVTGVLGAGTGLGVSGLIPADDGWVALGTEGGHATVAPRDERELLILRHVWRNYSHVSFERLLSGPGLELMYAALAEDARQSTRSLGAPEITRRGLAGTDPVCVATIDTFCGLLGTAASNLAVTLGALGGVFIGGGIVPKLGEYFDRSLFRSRFEDKGRFKDYLSAIPTFVITAPDATFSGASAILQAQLRALSSGPRSALLDRIRRGLDDLSPAERRVADHALAHPRKVLNEPIADIAAAANVSQPTVIRFCRSLGCEGLSDFKLRLASGLTGTLPVTHTQVTNDDSVAELSSKVLGNTAAAILQLRDQLNRDSITRAIELMDGADRIEFYAVGHYGVVAQDAQFKFLRFGISCTSYTDPRLQVLAAGVLRPRDVVVIISSGGRIAELLEAADVARSRGASVVAITASQSPLARKADAALMVDHGEDVATQLPMVSRILHLLIIDILAVGVAMRRSANNESAAANADEAIKAVLSLPSTPGEPAKRSPPGVSASHPMTHLTSHSS
jgi:glucokinase